MKRRLQQILLLASILVSAQQHLEAQQSTTNESRWPAESARVATEVKQGHGNRREISKVADQNKQLRYVAATLFVFIVGCFVWIFVMFLVSLTLDYWESNSRTPFAMPNEERRPVEIRLERCYLLILSVSLLVYYLTVPFVALGLFVFAICRFLVLLAGMAVGRIVFNLVDVLQEDLKIAFGVIHCAFIGTSTEPAGIKVSPETNRKLFEVFDEISLRFGSDPINAVYVTPTPDFCVYEVGSGPFGVFRRQRIMQIGISTISQLTVSEFQAILAHEFAHFCHRDTFYSRFIYQVAKSLRESLDVMLGSGILIYLNPFFWSHWLYMHSFLMLAAGFSRIREFLADRRAVANYGKLPFKEALRKVSFDNEFFGVVCVRNIQGRMYHGAAFLNLFEAYRGLLKQPEVEVFREEAVRKQEALMPGRFSSHPTDQERFDAIQNFPDTIETLDADSAISLLSDRKPLEEQLTDSLSCEIGGFRGFSALPDRIKRFDMAMVLK